MLQSLHTFIAAWTLVAAIDPLTMYIGAGAGATLLALFWPKKKAKKKSSPTGPKSNCPPLPPLDMTAVQQVVDEGVKQGFLGLMQFTSFVARTLYPTRSDGSTIPWPSAAPFVLPPNFDGSLQCRWEEIKGVLGDMNLPEAPTPTVADVISEILSPYPLPGRLYQIKNGDTLEGIVRQALNNLVAGGGQKFSARKAYILNCINTSAKWNVRLYGSSATSKAFPAYYLTKGIGMLAAFLPRHVNALQFLLQGVFPPRAITGSGAKTPMSQNIWAMLWLPPVDADTLAKFGEPVCTGHWDDGTPVTDPPPQLLELLREAA